MPTIPRPLLAAILAALVLPAAAAADTKTVGPGQPFTTIQAAVDAASPGDTIAIKPGPYQESVSVSKAGLTFAGELGAVVDNAGAASGSTPTFTFTATTGEPDTITGLIVANTVTTGPAIQGPGVGLIVKDSPAIYATKGDGIDLGGSDKNLIQRSFVASLVATGNALSISSTNSDAAKKLTLDSTLLIGGAAAVSVTSDSLLLTPAGAITVAARHVTAIGSIVADNTGALPAGQAHAADAITFLDSIVRGKRAAAASPSTATITADPARNSVADTAADAASLFVNAGKGNYHLRADAPVIGKGQVSSDESQTDIDGQQRSVSGVSDYGADEFVDRAPKAALSPASAIVRQNQSVSFDASKSSDPDAGDSIVSYHWAFGDGQTTTTTTPTTSHAYAAQGSFTAKVVAVDKEGGISPVASSTVTVTDGVPPTVKISSPLAGQHVTAYKGKHRLSVQFFGTAQDDKAMGKVLLALRPVAKTGGNCRWFDGKSKLLKASVCTAPSLFAATLSGAQWRFSLPLKAKLPKGLYLLYAAPVDASGLPGATKLVKFRIQ